MYICIYIYMYICIYVCIYIHIYTYVYIYIYTYDIYICILRVSSPRATARFLFDTPFESLNPILRQHVAHTSHLLRDSQESPLTKNGRSSCALCEFEVLNAAGAGLMFPDLMIMSNYDANANANDDANTTTHISKTTNTTTYNTATNNSNNKRNF